LKPSVDTFTDITDAFQTTTYDAVNGWGSSGIQGIGTEGLLTYYFSLNSANYYEDNALSDHVLSFATHQTNCNFPWNCHVDDAWSSATETTCRELNNAWYTFRQEFESKWSKTDLVNTTRTTTGYRTDFFLGYCTGNGTEGYQRASDYSSLSEEAQAWLNAHNSRRTSFVSLFPTLNVADVPLVWSNDIATSAQVYAERLVDAGNCIVQHGYEGDEYGGQNVAATWSLGSSSTPKFPEDVVASWHDDEIDTADMTLNDACTGGTELLYRSTRYMGCAQMQAALSLNGFDGTCTISVCRYIQQGRNLEQLIIEEEQTDLLTHFPSGCDSPQYFPAHFDNSNEWTPYDNWVCSVLGDTNPTNLSCPVTEGCWA